MPTREQRYCPNCNSITEYDSYRCLRCGYMYPMPVPNLTPQAPMKTCPQCRNLLIANAQQCPHCRYQFSNQTTPQTVPAKHCPQCNHLIIAALQQCPHCRHQFPNPAMGQASSQHSMQNVFPCVYCKQLIPIGVAFCPICRAEQVFHNYTGSSRYDEEPSANTSLIVVMWALTVLAFVTYTSNSELFGVATLTDIPALIMGIVLACSGSRTDRANGWVKISLEIIGFLLGFMHGLTASQRQW